MEHKPVRPDAESVLSENAAHRLLARAVELDAQRASNVSLAQLREIALEAGIATDAFDQALMELRDAPEEAATPAKRGLFREITTNVVAFALFMVVATLFGRVGKSFGLGWPAEHAAMIVANLAGIGIALRLRARVTAVVLGVTATMLIAEYPMHVLFGIQTVQGGATKWALMLAGLLGIGFGVMCARRAKPPEDTLADGAAEAADSASLAPARVSKPSPPGSLRLRTV